MIYLIITNNMNFIKKIFLLLIIIWTSYMILIFLSSNIADWIWNIFWIKSFNERIRWNAWNINKLSNNIPDAEKIKEWYNKALIKVKEYKKNIVNWIDQTKNTIDDFRVTMSWAEDTYNKAKWVLGDTIKSANHIKDTLGDLDKLSDWIKWTVNTNIIK